MEILLRPRPPDAILPGQLGHLPRALQLRLKDTVASGALGPTDMDPKVIVQLCEMPQAAALICIDRFLASNLVGIRNKSGFMVGILNRFKSGATMPSGTTVHVGNLASDVSRRHVRHIFECIGPVSELRFGPTYTFVEFADAQSAQAALALDGTRLAGANIKVAMATPTVQSVAGPGHVTTALASVTSPAALAALHNQNTAQRAGRAWGVSKRQSSDSESSHSDSSHDSRRRSRTSSSYRRRDRAARSDDSPSSSSRGASYHRTRRHHRAVSDDDPSVRAHRRRNNGCYRDKPAAGALDDVDYHYVGPGT